jgi:hypothetical protein
MAYQSGFCMTRHHASCKASLTYYDKTWYCECECHGNTETKLELKPATQIEVKDDMSKLQSKTTDTILAGARLAIQEGLEVLTARELAMKSAHSKGLKYANAFRNYEARILELAKEDTWLVVGSQTLTISEAGELDGKPAIRLTLTDVAATAAAE